MARTPRKTPAVAAPAAPAEPDTRRWRITLREPVQIPGATLRPGLPYTVDAATRTLAGAAILTEREV